MHRLTIAERVIAAAVLPLLVYFAARWLGGYLPLPDNDALAALGTPLLGLAAIALAVAAAGLAARSLSEPIAQADETVDAIVRAELGSAPHPGGAGRGEIERLMSGIDRLADVLREQQRRDLVLIDVDRKRRTARRTNLSNMASELESATEIGMRSILDGSVGLRAKADDMRTALETVRAASEETARAAESSRAINHDATKFSEQIVAAITAIDQQVGRDRSRAAKRSCALKIRARSSRHWPRRPTISARSSVSSIRSPTRPISWRSMRRSRRRGRERPAAASRSLPRR